ncbi:hypothetical protein AGMMS4956_01950 [Bacteroidia bacterium]|nr:hypothetical protein AGMMS4956_01950 [Bacteroidia bacterium]
MNKFLSCSKIVAVCLLLVASLVPAFGRQKVAVYVTGNNNAPENKIIASKLVSAITSDGYYEAIERTAAFLSQIQKEQEYQQSGAVADDQLSKLGQQMGVDYVCIAEVVPIGRAVFISARLVNVETAGVETTADVTCESTRDINAIVASANELAEKLVNPDGNVAPKPKAAPANTSKTNTNTHAFSEDNFSYVNIAGCGCDMEIQSADYKQKILLSEIASKRVSLLPAYGNNAFTAHPEAVNSFCPEGWRVPTLSEWECIYKNKEKIGNYSNQLYYSCELAGLLGFMVAIDFATGKQKKLKTVTAVANIRCVRCK